jgi:diketogulonate reductase-like aldo/keto reductase
MSEVPKVKLNTGDAMPAIGFGTWQINDQKRHKKCSYYCASNRL